MRDLTDCLIIGGGPAGLTAAIYAARFHLSVTVIDAGQSRAALIPRTRNHAGYPGGIAGSELLLRMRAQALEFGAALEQGAVLQLKRSEALFEAQTQSGAIVARSVILATGVTNRRIAMDDGLHAAAVAAGRLRYCPVCDGFEVTDQTVAVIGTGDHGVREALFLRSYTKRLTLISPSADHSLSTPQRQALSEAAIAIAQGPVTSSQLGAEGLSLGLAEGRQCFEAVYPALGSDIHSGLAGALGAKLTAEGCVVVDRHQRTSIAGLYAAGDVVMGLDQISHAMGEAGVAATTLRNDLDKAQPLRR